MSLVIYSLELSHQNGLGLEAASLVELELCIRSGCENSKIVFDSPAKTTDELIYALKLGSILLLILYLLIIQELELMLIMKKK
jgi:diaminopimelate decarboxylase